MEQAQLLGTRGAFIHECGELGFPLIKSMNGGQPKTNPIPDKTKNNLFKTFDDTNYQHFFEVIIIHYAHTILMPLLFF